MIFPFQISANFHLTLPLPTSRRYSLLTVSLPSTSRGCLPDQVLYISSPRLNDMAYRLRDCLLVVSNVDQSRIHVVRACVGSLSLFLSLFFQVPDVSYYPSRSPSC